MSRATDAPPIAISRFTFEDSADDVAGLLRELQVSQADLLGFSNGASVALQVAIRHPQLVRKLVFASSFTKREGAQPHVWEFIKQADIANMPQALKDAFLAVNPDSQKLKTMHDKDAARMAGFRDVPDAAVRGVRAPTLIITGDRDATRLEHAIELSRLFPDARLLVLPSGHGEYLAEASSAPADSDYAEITARLLEGFSPNRSRIVDTGARVGGRRPGGDRRSRHPAIRDAANCWTRR